jgi:hypothetical protein
LAHGFDYYFGDTVINFPPYCWIENDKVVDIPDTMMDTSKWKKIKEGGWECRSGPMFSGWDPYENIPTTTEKAVEYVKNRQATISLSFFILLFLPHMRQSFQMTSSMVSQVRGLMGILFMRPMMPVAEFSRHSNRLGRQIIR